MLLFQIHQPLDPRYALIALDIMREHQREPFAVRPSRPSRRSVSGSGVDRPHVRKSSPAAVCAPPPQHQTQAPRQDRFKKVIRSIYQHGEGCSSAITFFRICRLRGRRCYPTCLYKRLPTASSARSGMTETIFRDIFLFQTLTSVDSFFG